MVSESAGKGRIGMAFGFCMSLVATCLLFFLMKGEKSVRQVS